MRVSVAWRIGLNFGILIIFSFVLGYKGVTYVEEMSDANVKIYKYPFEFAKNARDIKAHVYEVSNLMHFAFMKDSQKDMLQLKVDIDIVLKEIDRHTNIIEKALLGERVSFMAYLATYKDWKKEVMYIENFLGNHEYDRAEKHFYKKYMKLEQRILMNTMALEEHADKTAKVYYDKSKMYVSASIFEYKVILFIVAFITLVFAYFIITKLIIPIRHIKNIIEDIALGKIDNKIEDLNRRDEIGDIFRAIMLLNKNIEHITKHADSVASGTYDKVLVARSADDKLIHSMMIMTKNLQKSATQSIDETWLQQGKVKMSLVLQEDTNLESLGEKIITILSEYTKAQMGALYLLEDKTLKLHASYAYTRRKGVTQEFNIGEGIIGQAAKERKVIIVEMLPDDYMSIESGLGQSKPKSVLTIPIASHEKLYGVLELAYFKTIPDLHITFFESIVESIGMAFENIYATVGLEDALSEAQRVSEELQVQEEELRVSNEKLQENSNALQRKKDQLEKSSKELEEKAIELENASRYKSEFLANMSHELRTPLNSLLILSHSLANNDEKNLNADEVESAKVIQESGEHLLSLINDILDISKVEAGQMVVSKDNVSTTELVSELKKRFVHMAKEKKIDFSISVQNDFPQGFISDRIKLGQIVTNLISNALKFTKKGGVFVRLEIEGKQLLLKVSDTGIGIPSEKQKTIFEAFQQADGSTTRNFGGTGLGLSIANSFSRLLGGYITVESEVGVGSSFTLTLPFTKSLVAVEQRSETMMSEAEEETKPSFEDDRDKLDTSKLLFLIIEDDEKFAKILYETCVADGNQAIVAIDGETGVLLAKRYAVQGIILDYMLPGLDGSDVLALLKGDKSTRNIPVHIMSALDNLMDMKQFGAIGQLKKPISKEKIREVLQMLGNDKHKKSDNILLYRGENKLNYVHDVLEEESLHTKKEISKEKVLQSLQEDSNTIVIIDYSKESLALLEFLKDSKLEKSPNILVYSERDLSEEEQHILAQYTQSIVIKSPTSDSRIVDEVKLFTNHMKINPTHSHERSMDLEGKSILLVDDDMRNTYSLAKIFRSKKLNVEVASSGMKALDILENTKDIDIILMDIMMPNMDGYEVTQRIRKMSFYKDIPILAVTANAMNGDKEKCLEAGASDYMSKPVDIDKLLVMIQMWL